jgi:poly(3-hydroxybutyrate) depolymerase
VVVLPAGLSETLVDTGENDTTWNCGAAADNSTCVEGTTNAHCLASCQRLGRCGRCNWATCYDDSVFVKTLVELLASSFRLDSTRYFVVGESNGGMLVHYLLSKLPGMFRAAAPTFGLPLAGYLVGPEYQLVTQRGLASTSSVLQLHDRSDTVIPWQGGESSDGWLYESRDRTMGVWAAIHNCSLRPVGEATPFDGGPSSLACWKYPGCAATSNELPSAAVIKYCMYDGGHGDWPDQPRADDLVWSFFHSASLRAIGNRGTA